MSRRAPGTLVSRRLDERPGNLPGQLFIHGGRAPTHLSVIRFERDGPRSLPAVGIDQLEPPGQGAVPQWVRLQGLADDAFIRSVLSHLAIPASLQAPLLDTPQRTRIDSQGEMVLVVMHRLSFAESPAHLVGEQVGLLLLPGLLISVEEVPKPSPFPELSAWLASLVPPPGPEDLDDILHFLIDELLDGLFPMLERVADLLDGLEEAALRNPKPNLLNRAYQARSNLREIRNQVWPLRYQILVLLRQNQRLLGPAALEGFRDMEQHVALIFENCELLRHQCDAVTDAYMASTGNRMNQVMKTLTIVSSIFAPLTFVAGIYGMNFRNMPELQWRYGYFLLLFLMALIALLQTFWLWRRGWFEDWTAARR